MGPSVLHCASGVDYDGGDAAWLKYCVWPFLGLRSSSVGVGP